MGEANVLAPDQNVTETGQAVLARWARTPVFGIISAAALELGR